MKHADQVQKKRETHHLHQGIKIRLQKMMVKACVLDHQTVIRNESRLKMNAEPDAVDDTEYRKDSGCRQADPLRPDPDAVFIVF